MIDFFSIITLSFIHPHTYAIRPESSLRRQGQPHHLLPPPLQPPVLPLDPQASRSAPDLPIKKPHGLAGLPPRDLLVEIGQTPLVPGAGLLRKRSETQLDNPKIQQGTLIVLNGKKSNPLKTSAAHIFSRISLHSNSLRRAQICSENRLPSALPPILPTCNINSPANRRGGAQRQRPLGQHDEATPLDLHRAGLAERLHQPQTVRGERENGFEFNWVDQHQLQKRHREQCQLSQLQYLQNQQIQRSDFGLSAQSGTRGGAGLVFVLLCREQTANIMNFLQEKLEFLITLHQGSSAR